MFSIKFSNQVEHDLVKIKRYHRNIIFEVIEKQLTYEPINQTKKRKELSNLIPPFETIPPVWEIRVEE